MSTLSDRDQRTLRFAGMAIAIYLVLFFGFRTWKQLEAKRTDYLKLTQEAEAIKKQIQPYENRILLLEKLKENFHIDPARLSKATLVAEASAAIQKAATSGGIQLGPVRESPARASAKELASMQLEGMGPPPAILGLLHRLTTLGYPFVIDTVQVNPETTRPGMLKVNLTIVILDFDQWKKEEEVRNA